MGRYLAAPVAFAFVVLFSLPAIAKDLSCTETANSSITWDYQTSNWETKAKRVTKDGMKISFKNVGAKTVEGTPSFLVGNTANVEIVKVSGSDKGTFYRELTGAGNVVTWAVFESAAKGQMEPPFWSVVSTKAYYMGGPATFTSVFKCN